VAGPPDGRTFGARLREIVAAVGHGGLVVLGSGALPLATVADRRDFVAAACGADPAALANDRFSADCVAIARIDRLPRIPDLPNDNVLPRWLAETAGHPVYDLRRRWRLGVDIDGPLDIVLAGGCGEADDADTAGIDTVAVTERLDAIRHATRDPGAELLVAGRTSARALAWLERHTASRTRALVEERGLRTARHTDQRPAASILGMLLDRDGPTSIGSHLASLADAAIVDSRVLLAHHFGGDQAAWPNAEDRFASDLLLADRIADPWLKALTSAAATAPIPVLLGGHTLVGPGLRLAIGGSWS
jgi:hypothetical protein